MSLFGISDGEKKITNITYHVLRFQKRYKITAFRDMKPREREDVDERHILQDLQLLF
jgi:hypothetical protein